ncbi:mechanosensitive ion channel family protein [Flavobacterium sp.]|uniref:mechanosensitive ion channel family protein n=1 Tax=Flavobacterium sp. TaxID=239 RepID=UPI002C72F4CA|nr:mechanosensitive ion channel domain-containing protein [Flavobacterium sp.]HSD06914.1 mechanosensitive ion channel domain-containing protein [Flavobacterium sp.]
MFLKGLLKNTITIFLCSVVFLVSQKVIAQPKQEATTTTTTELDESKVPILIGKIETYNFTIDRSRFLLQRGYDVSAIENALPDIERRIKGFKKRFEKRGKKANLRSLNSSVILLKEISENLASYKRTVSGYSDELTKKNEELKKILNDPELHIQLEDSILRTQLTDVLTEAKQLNKLQKKTLAKLNLLTSRVSINLFQTQDLSSDMVYLSISKKINMWSQEESPLFSAKSSEYENSFFDNVIKALQRSGKILMIYLKGKINIVFFSLLLFVGITAWMTSNKRRIKKMDDSESILAQVKFLNKSVIVGSLFSFFTYLPFLFGNPTMSLLHTIELIRLVLLSLLILPFLTQQGKMMWFSVFAIWIFYAIDDVLLDPAFGERWALFIVGIVFLFLCVKIIKSKNSLWIGIEPSIATKALIIFSIVQVVLSLAFNLTGRLSLSKIFGVSAVQCLVLGVTLKVFCTVIVEAIYMQTEAYRSSRFSDFINFKELQHSLIKYLWLLAAVIFIIGFARNITFYDLLMSSCATFFNETRSIGSFKFTFLSIAIFIFILWLSSIISGFISFFFREQSTSTGKRSGLNSMMLLIRLAIWTVGFFIAVAAAGIPIDKLSIMLGALGVGIGFGLQNVVNNLVSGIIIAFERPIQIGDQIEIGNKSGVVKEIGVRSSKIHSAEGSDIIVPNGDLLSQHLINWTMQDRSRRIEFTIGVPYSTDVEMARKLISEKLAQNEKVLTAPKPNVIIQDFGEYAVTLKTLFWVADLSQANEVRTETMNNVKTVLTEAGINLQIKSS